MGNWRTVATEVMREGVDLAPRVALENYGLPNELASALRRLETMPPPRKLERPGNWRGVVADAMMLARDRWACKAMALGWTAGDLFGVGSRSDWDFQGLAVWLDGRRIVMLDERQVIVAASADRIRCAFVRGGMGRGAQPSARPVMLWDFGR